MQFFTHDAANRYGPGIGGADHVRRLSDYASLHAADGRLQCREKDVSELRENPPEPDASIMCIVSDFVTLVYGAVHGPIMKTSTAKDPVGTGTFESGAIRGNLRNFTCESVLAPLPHVAGHVVKAELVGSFQADRLRVIAVSAVVPSHGVDSTAAAEGKALAPGGASTSGVLPLGLRREPKRTA